MLELLAVAVLIGVYRGGGNFARPLKFFIIVIVLDSPAEISNLRQQIFSVGIDFARRLVEVELPFVPRIKISVERFVDCRDFDFQFD